MVVAITFIARPRFFYLDRLWLPSHSVHEGLLWVVALIFWRKFGESSLGFYLFLRGKTCIGVSVKDRGKGLWLGLGACRRNSQALG